MNKNILPKSFNVLIEKLNESIKAKQKISSKWLKELVEKIDFSKEDLAPFADFDHPIEDCYGRKMLYKNDLFEVMVMSWNPRDYSSIHNHGYTQWGIVQVFGNTHHLIYNDKNGVLSFAKKELAPEKTILKVNNAFIHQMGNATTAPYQTLHIYGLNEPLTEITADARNYNLEFESIAHTSGGAFFNLPESEIYDVEPAPKPTQEVFMHNAYLLMDYYNKQIQTEKIVALKENLMGKIEEHVFVTEDVLI